MGAIGYQRFVAALGLAVGLAAASPVRAQDCTASGQSVDLDFEAAILPNLGGSATPHALNNLGQVVGDSNLAFGSSRWAYLWSGGAITRLPTVTTANGSSALAINDREEILGWQSTDTDFIPTVWDTAGNFVDLRTLVPVLGPFSAFDLNNRGDVLGRESTGSRRGFVYNLDAGSLRFLPGGVLGAVINNHGTVAGRYLVGDVPHLFTWSGGDIIDHGTVGDYLHFVEDINDAGVTVGTHSMAPPHHPSTSTLFAYKGTEELPGGRRDDGGWPKFDRGDALGINRFGDVVGGVDDEDHPDAGGFLWHSGGALALTSIADTIDGANLVAVDNQIAINDLGQIAGLARTTFGRVQALLNPGPSIDAIDVNPEVNPGLVDATGQVTTDAQALAASGLVRVGGLAADGVTPVVVRMRTPSEGIIQLRVRDENGLAQDVGTLSTLGGSEDASNLAVATQQIDGIHWAFAVLRAPADFPRASGADVGQETRPLCLEAEFTPLGGSERTSIRQLALHRPPVVLIHGLWSNPDTWAWDLKDDPTYVVHRVDYSNTAAASFQQNVVHPRVGRSTAVRLLREKGVAATQVDVFGHSMGGLLTRLHVANARGDYSRPDNFQAGDVHKLVTVNTPHLGSPLANILLSLSFVYGPRFDAAVARIGHPVDQGAIFDLQTDSTEILQLPRVDLPVHAVVGTGGSDYIDQDLPVPGPAGRLWSLLQFVSLVTFSGDQHDGIVSRTSQEGGLGTGVSQTSLFGFKPGLHIAGVTEEAVVDVRARELLDTPLDDATVFAAGFPGGLEVPDEPSPPVPTVPQTVEENIAITVPAPGSIVAPGASLGVTVEGVGGFVPERVLVVSSLDVVNLAGAPFSTTVDVPLEAAGPVVLSAFAYDAAGNLAAAPDVEIMIDVPAALTGLSPGEPTLTFFSFSPPVRARAVGHYDDGVDRPLDGSALGTTYASNNACVASIDAEGFVTSGNVGSTDLTISNGGFQAQVVVEVASAVGDFDANGWIDDADADAFAAALGSDVGDPAYRDEADFDDDGTIGSADELAFQAARADPCNVLPPARVLMVGDSITEGTVSGTPGSSYAEVAAGSLVGDFDVLNAACGDTSAGDWLPGAAPVACAGVPMSLWAERVAPRLPAPFATVLLGTYDAIAAVEPDDYAIALSALVDELQDGGVDNILLMTPPPRCTSAPQDVLDRLGQYRLGVQTLCLGKAGVKCGPNVHGLLDPVADFASCEVHPNAQGHATLGAALAEDVADLAACTAATTTEEDACAPVTEPLAGGVPIGETLVVEPGSVRLDINASDPNGLGFPVFAWLGTGSPVDVVWDFGGATAAGPLAAFNPSPLVTFALGDGDATQSYTLTGTAYDTSGDHTTASFDVIATLAPQVSVLADGVPVTGPLSVASGDTVSFTAIADDADGLGYPIFQALGNNALISYVWNLDGASVPGPLYYFHFQTPVTFELDPGEGTRTFDVSVTVFDTVGRSTTVPITVEVYEKTP